MKVILVFVSTLDGKVTRWGDPFVKKWTSGEDKSYFRKILLESQLVVMGSKSYLAEPVSPRENRLAVVLTHTPEKYREFAVPGMIEFTRESPAEIVERFRRKGYDVMTVLGGPTLATSFLQEQLIDELWLTIEPKLFGTGDILVTKENLDIDLRLESLEKVNEQGTLLTRYSIIKK